MLKKLILKFVKLFSKRDASETNKIESSSVDHSTQEYVDEYEIWKQENNLTLNQEESTEKIEDTQNKVISSLKNTKEIELSNQLQISNQKLNSKPYSIEDTTESTNQKSELNTDSKALKTKESTQKLKTEIQPKQNIKINFELNEIKEKNTKEVKLPQTKAIEESADQKSELDTEGKSLKPKSTAQKLKTEILPNTHKQIHSDIIETKEKNKNKNEVELTKTKATVEPAGKRSKLNTESKVLKPKTPTQNTKTEIPPIEDHFKPSEIEEQKKSKSETKIIKNKSSIKKVKEKPFDEMTPYELGETKRIEALKYLIPYLIKGTINEKRLSASAVGKLSSVNKVECNKLIPLLLNNLDSEGHQVRQYSLITLAKLDLTMSDVEYIKLKSLKDIKDYNRQIAKQICHSYQKKHPPINHELKKLVQEREIKYLFHFTRVDNLTGILDKGLIPVKSLNANNSKFFYNDEVRLDQHDDANCLSISFPNYRFFYNLRVNSNGAKWCVLKYESNVLWEKECGFCLTNAANSSERTRSLEEKKSLESFKSMFFNEGYRVKEGIPSYYPTNVQAEVLVFDTIENNYLDTVYFLSSDVEVANYFRVKYPKINFENNDYYFSKRLNNNSQQQIVKM